MLKILTVTGSRSEYDLLYPLLKRLEDHKLFDLNILICGSHLNKNFGNTINYIKRDKFKNLLRLKSILKNNDNDIQIFNSYNYLNKSIAKILKKKNIDILLVLGDRFEAHASSIAAYFLKKPIIHIGGGDTSYGSMDEFFRNSISIMSNLHFPKILRHKQKLMKLGVDKKTICVAGSLSNENHISSFKNDFIIKKPFVLATFHPVTNTKKKKDNDISNLLKALASYKKLNVIFTASNHDSGGSHINDKIIKHVKKNKNFIFVPNLGRKLYHQAMNNCEFMIGNSSSGVIESMIYKKPSINILPRQLGRKGNLNIIHCKNEYGAIVKSINKALSKNFKKKCQEMINIFLDKKKIPSLIIINQIIKKYG